MTAGRQPGVTHATAVAHTSNIFTNYCPALVPALGSARVPLARTTSAPSEF
jgi:hypothetical protein